MKTNHIYEGKEILTIDGHLTILKHHGDGVALVAEYTTNEYGEEELDCEHLLTFGEIAHRIKDHMGVNVAVHWADEEEEEAHE